MNVVILVPRRRDDGWRDRLWEYCLEIWRERFPDWAIVEGHHEASEGPFNRALAINRASTIADEWAFSGQRWDVALIIDSDTVSDPDAVRRTVAYAAETGVLSIAHNERHMLSRRATESVLAGADVTGLRGRYAIKRTYYDSVSCAVAVRRQEWDAVGGFDEEFVGWGFEDTAFRVAVETVTDRVMHVEQAPCYHLWHETSPEASKDSPTFSRNYARKVRYERAHYQPERLRALLAGESDPGITLSTIPKILHRTVPAETDETVEAWWRKFEEMHPDWELRTWRDPLDPEDFPLTAHLHDRCASGAQKAGLVRLELLVTHGGVYVDSDVEPIRPLDALTHLPAFAAWEDEKVVPDAVLGAMPGHPAFRAMLAEASRLIEGGSTDAWATGPGVTTSILPWRDDVLLLPPGSFYPVHYKEKTALGSRNNQPWVFLEHKWHHSWAAPKRGQQPPRARQTPPAAEPRESGVSPTAAASAPPPDLNMAICMPWEDRGDKHRRAVFEWCDSYWDGHGFAVYEGGGHSRSKMCNVAAVAAIADGAEVLVFTDADTWAPIEQVVQAAITAKESGQLVHAFTRYVKLDQGRTRALLRRDPRVANAHSLARASRPKEHHVSGLTAVPLALWERLGGFDERFVGWGFEDQAFHLAAEVLGGGTQRVEGPAIHIYHRVDPSKHNLPVPGDPRLALMQDYCNAAGRAPAHGRVGRLVGTGFIEVSFNMPNAERMQDVLSKEGGPLSRPDAVS